MNRLRDMLGDDFEPVTQMAKNADFLQKAADKQAAAAADELEVPADVAKAVLVANGEWDRVAKYTTPQLKSIEVTLDADVGVHGGLPEVDDLVEELVSGDADSHTEEGSPD